MIIGNYLMTDTKTWPTDDTVQNENRTHLLHYITVHYFIANSIFDEVGVSKILNHTKETYFKSNTILSHTKGTYSKSNTILSHTQGPDFKQIWFQLKLFVFFTFKA